MEIVLLIPSSLSIAETFKNGFTELGHKVQLFDFKNDVKDLFSKVNGQIFRFPYFIKRRWYDYYFDLINQSYINFINANHADLYLIYNSQMLTPAVVELMKTKGSRIAVIMGDSPYYTKTNKHYLNLLFEADQIFVPDSYWIEQLSMLGIDKVEYFVMGFNPHVYKKVKPTQDEMNRYATNCVFMGLNYDSLLGFKRTLFLSKFAQFGLKIYGDKNWNRWIEQFPELNDSLIKKQAFIPGQEWNLICNCAKLHPVDANPGLTNGIHIRVFDSIGSGILPIVEYRKDIEQVFPNNILPSIKSYNKITDIASYYLKNDAEREHTTEALRSHIIAKYSYLHACNQILASIKF
ncbi:MAG: glycosyltransferase [Salinivirgaceae bacterium]|jgi:hypothetical protein|nr:glycosyltransferase [Salinivirgaceae bacterium]